MGRLLAAIATALTMLAPAAWASEDFDGTIDIRAVSSDGERSYVNGGLGDLRYDEDHDGLRLGELRLGFRADVDQIVHVVVEAADYDDHNRYPIDLTEAFAEVRPFPINGWRSRFKVGAFYAPISLENWLTGWRSAYTLSPSAINTWIGEELRTIGAEFDLDWLGRQSGHDWEFELTAATYGWNELAGGLIARRGWAISDLQTTLFGRIGEPGNGPIDGIREFYEIDHRFGYYTGGSANYRDSLNVRALHYDNRANPDVYSPAAQDYAWHMSFDSVGASWTPTMAWTVLAQWLGGETCVGVEPYCWRFHAAYWLASWLHGADRVSARYDLFQMNKTNTEGFYNFNDGHAWTLAYQHLFSSHWSVVLEALQIDSRLLERERIGEPVGANEQQLQLAGRYEFF